MEKGKLGGRIYQKRIVPTKTPNAYLFLSYLSEQKFKKIQNQILYTQQLSPTNLKFGRIPHIFPGHKFKIALLMQTKSFLYLVNGGGAAGSI